MRNCRSRHSNQHHAGSATASLQMSKQMVPPVVLSLALKSQSQSPTDHPALRQEETWALVLLTQWVGHSTTTSSWPSCSHSLGQQFRTSLDAMARVLVGRRRRKMRVPARRPSRSRPAQWCEPCWSHPWSAVESLMLWLAASKLASGPVLGQALLLPSPLRLRLQRTSLRADICRRCLSSHCKCPTSESYHTLPRASRPTCLRMSASQSWAIAAISCQSVGDAWDQRRVANE
mmetsp:Transcript_46166/g.118619  ORF Transcript_46166/g.118619 Transcript_46166/m.118619 type:complete len:232 (+) Transcript_46166:532-1227(+)